MATFHCDVLLRGPRSESGSLVIQSCCQSPRRRSEGNNLLVEGLGVGGVIIHDYAVTPALSPPVEQALLSNRRANILVALFFFSLGFTGFPRNAFWGLWRLVSSETLLFFIRFFFLSFLAFTGSESKICRKKTSRWDEDWLAKRYLQLRVSVPQILDFCLLFEDGGQIMSWTKPLFDASSGTD